jgi:hypothetical protein
LARRFNLNRPPHLPYNALMPSRPQFSLRMLLFVVVIVCLAAATLSPLPAGQEIASYAQILLRAMLCIALPAMLTTGAIHERGYRRTFFVGALFPTATALLTVCVGIAGQWDTIIYGPSEMLSLWQSTQGRAWFIAGLWAFAPVCGLVCVFFHWVFQLGTIAKGE